ncbi:class I adenylate-forming enzyme family protein [Bacillus sp. MUM 13]|uniref:class I adenylate-forming enzyme family protein n=1 Tax=Bacillus sp. MUM 13 TaxID=1678001 RepID=UPI0008F5AF71|nr:class I adenylate-forming enzyme family protein [Bacillus sp. MUM 13]OIK09983.1 hypothetical protein BIV59_15520 [Bacillus sp. MUM 13]
MKTFYDLIFDENKNWDKEILFTNVNGYSLRDIHSKVEEYTHILQSNGGIKGKKVAVLIPDLPVYFALLIAINRLGGTCVPLSHQFRNEDLSKVLNLIRPHIIFTVKKHYRTSFFDMIKDWAQAKFIQTKIYAHENNRFESHIIQGYTMDETSKGIDFIACTSGSTGLPKGVMLQASSLDEWTKILESELELTKIDRLFMTIPYTAPYGISWLLTCFKNEIAMVIPESFDMPLVMKLLEENTCNKIITTPSIFKGIYIFAKSVKPNILHDVQLCILGGEPINEEFMSVVKDFNNCRLVNAYGISEQGLLAFTNDLKSEAVKWSFCKNVQFKMNAVSSDGIGELMIKTPYGFDGYYQDEELTSEAFTGDGWFFTGDLVRTNDQGALEMVGRKKQMIKKGGVQVIPAEIEQILIQYPQILQSAVIGIPHKVYGEEIIAFIVSDNDISLDSLFSFLRSRIAGFKVPGRIIKIKEMPIIQGKLDKMALKKLAAS